AAALVVRHYPGRGSRHDLGLGLAGVLLLSGFTQEEGEHFIARVARAAGDDEVADRVAAVRTTARRMADGSGVAGWQQLGQHIGIPAAGMIRKWIGSPARESEWAPPMQFRTYRLPDFPIDALAPWLATYVADLAKATQTPADLAGCIAL